MARRNPMVQGLSGLPAVGFQTKAGLAAGQLEQEFPAVQNVNMIRFFAQVILTSAAPNIGGTGTIFDSIIQRIRIYKGTKQDAQRSGSAPIVDIDNFAVYAAYLASIARMKRANSMASVSTVLTAGLPTVVDPVVANGALTYDAWADLMVQEPGQAYYMLVDYASPAGLPVIGAGLSGATVGMTAMFINYGYDVPYPEIWKVGIRFATQGFTLGNTRETLIGCLTTDLAVILSYYTYDIVMNQFGIKSSEGLFDDLLGTPAVAQHFLYRSADVPTALHIELNTPTNITFCAITY